MNKKEIKKLIEEEKAQMRLFLRLAKRIGLSDEETENQIDFYLDRINALQNQYDNSPD